MGLDCETLTELEGVWCLLCFLGVPFLHFSILGKHTSFLRRGNEQPESCQLFTLEYEWWLAEPEISCGLTSTSTSPQSSTMCNYSRTELVVIRPTQRATVNDLNIERGLRDFMMACGPSDSKHGPQFLLLLAASFETVIPFSRFCVMNFAWCGSLLLNLMFCPCR